jgi:TolB-like protein
MRSSGSIRLAAVLVMATVLASGCRPPAAPDVRPVSPTAAAVRSGAPFPPVIVVSVLPFEERGRVPDAAWLRKGLPDMLIAQLVRVPSLVVVQRERLEEVLREQRLQMSGRVAEENAVHVGRLAGATVLITGSMTKIGSAIRFESQILGVEQGIVLGTASAEGPAEDATAMARVIAARMASLFPNAGAPGPVESSEAFSTAARATESGERLWQDGTPMEALTALERAMAADPGYGPARWTYGRVAQAAMRIAKQFLETAFVIDTDPPRTEQAADGTSTLIIPVRISVAPSAVAALVDAATAGGGGQVSSGAGKGELLDLSFGRDDMTRQVADRLLAPRRLYLKLLAADQRVIGVYSRLREWVPATWVSASDGRRLRIARARAIEDEAVFAGLSEQQVAAMFGLRLTVEPAAREQASVRVDMVARDASLRDSRPRTREELLRAPATDTRAADELRKALERAWRPPVGERPWGPGYRPGNERTAVVLIDRDDAGRLVVRLNRPSGDTLFDDAAVSAASDALAHGAVVPQDPALRMRAQFRVVKDLPLLNVIESSSRTQPLAARGSPSR